MVKVAVSPVLSHIKEHLSEEGIEVINFENKNFARLPGEVSAIVISGLDNNFLGMEDIQASIPVINAEGRTPEEISTEIRKRVF
jgi:putative N-acetylmannosamine-6-phosphate epimerase